MGPTVAKESACEAAPDPEQQSEGKEAADGNQERPVGSRSTHRRIGSRALIRIPASVLVSLLSSRER